MVVGWVFFFLLGKKVLVGFINKLFHLASKTADTIDLDEVD